MAPYTIRARLLLGVIHLWYVPALILAGLILMVTRRRGLKTVLIAAASCFAVGILMTYLGQMGDGHSGTFWRFSRSGILIRNGMVLGYPFFAIGYVLNLKQIPEKISTMVCANCLAFGVIALIVESAFCTCFTRASRRWTR